MWPVVSCRGREESIGTLLPAAPMLIIRMALSCRLQALMLVSCDLAERCSAVTSRALRVAPPLPTAEWLRESGMLRSKVEADMIPRRCRSITDSVYASQRERCGAVIAITSHCASAMIQAGFASGIGFDCRRKELKIWICEISSPKRLNLHVSAIGLV